MAHLLLLFDITYKLKKDQIFVAFSEYLKFTKIFNILHFRAENSVSSFTLTIMMKMEVEWLQKRSNFQAHRAQIHFVFKSLVFQSRKAALIFFTKKRKINFRCWVFNSKSSQRNLIKFSLFQAEVF